MALVQRKISKAKQLRLAGALALIIGATLSVAYFGLLRRGGPPSASTAAVSSAPAERSVASIPSQTGFEAASELEGLPLFRALRTFGVWPLPLDPRGRSQPFILESPESPEL
ncbi:MAG: hypothetical protein HYW81_01430 [Parcubacteria group bacterium]|nr:hypothetical protein [Parcubacteria group bacterium]